MKIYLEPDDLDVRIEIIPLIDVIFCILVFFILGAVSFSRTQALNVDLPTAESAQTEFDSTLNVVIDTFGQTSIVEKDQNIPVSEDQLLKLLTAYVRQYPQGIVQLQADKVVSYGQVIRVFDLLRQVGGNRVGLAVIEPDSSENKAFGSTPTAPDLLQPQPNLTQPSDQMAQPSRIVPQPANPENSLLPQQPSVLPSPRSLAPAPGQPR
jgi:biopolymer transport protein ExbD